jgi:hypothetical protein
MRSTPETSAARARVIEKECGAESVRRASPVDTLIVLSKRIPASKHMARFCSSHGVDI